MFTKCLVSIRHSSPHWEHSGEWRKAPTVRRSGLPINIYTPTTTTHTYWDLSVSREYCVAHCKRTLCRWKTGHREFKKLVKGHQRKTQSEHRAQVSNFSTWHFLILLRNRICSFLSMLSTTFLLREIVSGFWRGPETALLPASLQLCCRQNGFPKRIVSTFNHRERLPTMYQSPSSQPGITALNELAKFPFPVFIPNFHSQNSYYGSFKSQPWERQWHPPNLASLCSWIFPYPEFFLLFSAYGCPVFVWFFCIT